MKVILDEDYELVQQSQAGIKKAFEQLFVKYHKKVFNKCYSMLSIREDAEDAAQEVFFNVHKKINTFKNESKFSTWLYQITINHCLNIIKKPGINGPMPPEIGDDRQSFNPVRDCVRSKLAQLEEIHRSVIALVHFGEMSYAEAAQVLECKVGTIRSRVNRAMEKLEPILRECLE